MFKLLEVHTFCNAILSVIYLNPALLRIDMDSSYRTSIAYDKGRRLGVFSVGTIDQKLRLFDQNLDYLTKT